MKSESSHGVSSTAAIISDFFYCVPYLFLNIKMVITISERYKNKEIIEVLSPMRVLDK